MWTCSAAFILFLFTMSLWAQPQTAAVPAKTGDALELVKQGQKLNSEGRQDEALALYERALQLSPGLYQAELATGVALDLQGKYSQARQHLQKAIDVAPPNMTVQALRTMAVSDAFECKPIDATKYEQQAYDSQLVASQFADAAGTADELARIYLECGDVDAAAHWYQNGHQTAMRTTGMKDADKDLWAFRWESAQARIAARRGQRDQAQKHLAAAKAALDKGGNPDQVRFYPYLAGYVAFYGGDYKTAIAQLKQADQKDPFVLLLLAQAEEKSGENAQALDYYRQILAINNHTPTNAFARPLAKEKLAAQAK
jgi:tetratricopeptide (TPR) repeat protein